LDCSIDFFFFFQAEDGIRDLIVTGVQTCALPISERGVDCFLAGDKPSFVIAFAQTQQARKLLRCDHVEQVIRESLDHAIVEEARSEERRVGKECRCWWWRYQ